MDLVVLVVPAAASWLALPLSGWRRWAGWTWWLVCLVASVLVFVGHLLVGAILGGAASILGYPGDPSYGWLLPWAVVAVALQAGAALGLARSRREAP